MPRPKISIPRAVLHRLMAALWRCVMVLCALSAFGPDSRAAEPAMPGPLVLDVAQGTHELWDHASLLIETRRELSAAEVIALSAEFQPMGPIRSNLGKQTQAVWIRVPVTAPADARTPWVLDIDYASLDQIDVYLAGEPGASAPRLIGNMGDHLSIDQRPMRSRAHTMEVDLPPGQTRTLLLRVKTTGSMVVPMLLCTHKKLHEREASEQVLQGLLAGAGLSLFLYSMAQWVTLRDAMFGLYALTLLGSVGFFAALSGVGPQHVWGANPWLTRNGPPFFILLGVCGAFFFVLRALEVATSSPRTARLVSACGGLAGLTALAFLLGLVPYGVAQAVGMGLGPAPLLLVLPTAFSRSRAGDKAARFVLLGWGAYALGVLVLVSLLFGGVPVNFWTLHTFQFASLAEMGMWMMVLGQRVHDIREGAKHMQHDRDRMRSLALTDALTSLLNRRGLQEAAPGMLGKASAHQIVVLYLLDLDGFKLVNDTLGHEAGDELLVGVAGRLRKLVRGTDLVCRLGGDEFVVMVSGLAGPDAAMAVGAKLLASVDEPFVVADRPTSVGMTVGYAIAPHDDVGFEGLMRRADAAMYAGKQAGKNCVQRGAARSPLANAGVQA